MPSAWRFLLAWAALALAGCSTTADVDRYALRVERGEALDVPHVRQTSRADCGLAALASVMAYYVGPGHSHEALRQQYPPASPEGYSLGELRGIARLHGFSAFVVPGDAAFLDSHLARGRPLIVPLQVPAAVPVISRATDVRYDHYVVVVGIDEARRRIILIDPARGPVELELEDFAAGWERMNHAALLVGLSRRP